MMRKIFRLLFIIIVFALLSGCGLSGSIYSNYRAIEQLQLIEALGIDRTQEGITLSAATGKSGESDSSLVLRRSAGSILKAMDALQDHSVRGQLYFAHTQYVVLGQDYARDGIGEILDFVERDVNTRMGSELYLVRGGTAEELITGAGDAGYDIMEILLAVKRDTDLRGDSHVFNFRDTAVGLSENGASLICALRIVNTEGSVFSSEPGISAVPDGYGILKDGRLVGFLDGRDAEAASLLLGQFGSISRAVSDGAGGKITLEFSGGADISPAWNEDGSPAPVEIRVKLNAAVAELATDRQQILDKDYLEFLSQQLGADIRQDILRVLAISQTTGADFLALGGALRVSGGDAFGRLPENWLQELGFHVTVDAAVDRNYDMEDPVRTNGGER